MWSFAEFEIFFENARAAKFRNSKILIRGRIEISSTFLEELLKVMTNQAMKMFPSHAVSEEKIRKNRTFFQQDITN